MKLSVVLLALALASAFAAEESCVGRCHSFNPMTKCQCDSMCRYYSSCCMDFDSACPRKISRGDTFDAPEDDVVNTPTTAVNTNSGTMVDPETTNIPPVMNTTAVPTTTLAPTTTIHTPTLPPDPEAVPCSGKPFDAFLQLKNGSIYAFRGDYFFELDERAVVPGYPKLIYDKWGIRGPIDAAFTRINCQGKTYIFKGNKYWRFEDDVLDADYPRDISVGFEKVPTDVDAAFAIPAPGHHGKEKVYFFKGDQYYQYEFKHQPSHEECVRLTKSSPSVLFTRYTDLYCDDTWENLFTMLFQGLHGHKKGPRFINKDWVGIKSPIDAAMVGRLYISPKPAPSPSPTPRRRANRWRKDRRRGQRGRARQSRSAYFEDFFLDDHDWMGGGFTYDSDYSDYTPTHTTHDKTLPVQNVYFFKKDKYYRVDLQTKHIDFASPPYPRSIAKYWLGCKQESGPDREEIDRHYEPMAEKK
ncbi:vitronectin b precursor [Oncorhynchus mykiss]|uniref:Vitronectin protein 1 n=1 Tax=Oncorhynchus mykiss TaxID=8022 RepID=Q2MCX5_ONCMY|nr:vitronectin b precursor [Oncorhynchus mykiss]CAJ57657.2 vitronectin protein 1 [Oncorhynchus mykiss]